ncbi:uncharacterized protein A1O9_08092 [Exophiala aquamarina CBS 119918]|uniref:Nudix hydrolase domain-containing protein n=1 Tax=Exophiala aquamarina CBS 119918 TaxID=1182545 RepID=A0A072P6L0_9EURO|nr:uncharacterized protein A1O9_08092 [Exophiala aquamarina CBS 119918]KEF55342.1 hypothetical protein A1O9_08092 [Exophiala aquamarina CBS 119918]
MLNENMDEVVLVKGWKKSANWSFPRGKINKDENDLDCAVREVYEETGFDIRAAGLVKDEKDMKYIEVTMREQHMRLYVFRGVPKDTYFEPKTRKEISKIEWYKLTDLPTLKKSRQHEGSGTDQPAVNANKFYMVAPFLNPLKKWIAQQRKKENRYSSHLSAPPMVLEEVTTEDDQDTNGAGARLTESGTPVISDLPEVSAPVALDPSSHLRKFLSIGQPSTALLETAPQPSHMQKVDTEKSNALLALLRGSTVASMHGEPKPPFEQVLSQPEVQRSPHASHTRHTLVDQEKPPPVFQTSQTSDRYPAVQDAGIRDQGYAQAPQAPAPYQQTGDPQFARPSLNQARTTMVPPASALPKLTNHTKALLDVFKGATKPAEPPLSNTSHSLSQGLLGSPASIMPRTEYGQQSGGPTQRSSQFSTGGDQRHNRPTTPAPLANFHLSPIEKSQSQASPATVVHRPDNVQRASLLNLFSQPSQTSAAGAAALQALAREQGMPAELAATGASGVQRSPQPTQNDPLLILLRQGNQEQKPKASNRPMPREGETSATISGPLNQPEFEAVSRTTKHVSNDLGRSPLTSNRTLFDPKQPTPIKILTKPEEQRQGLPRSPRGPKPTTKRTTLERSTPKAPVKAFQPQILRRPQTIETSDPADETNQPTNQPSTDMRPVALVQNTNQEMPGILTPSQDTPRSDAHKQTLLSLFGRAESTPKAPIGRGRFGTVSPLSSSQVLSPNTEVPLSGIEAISTRTSRVGSLTSTSSGPAVGRPANEKRQTAAENKAFLLGYLGRIANQET